MNDRKLKLLETLDSFVSQRPGLDPRDYGEGMDGYRLYRQESAAITRDMHDYYAIRGNVAWRDSITADDIIKASKSAFSGRLTIEETDGCFTLSYYAGQYMPTEYRKAACAVLAAAWWAATRNDCPAFETDERGDFIGGNPGEWMRDKAKKTFPRRVANGYFG